MDEETLRYQCLVLAHGAELKPEHVVDRAREYVDFVLGRRDAEIIRAAGELAEKIRG